MNKTKSPMACVILLMLCMPVFGQNNCVLMVSGKGQLRNYPGFRNYVRVFPKVAPNTQSITVTLFPLISDMGEMRRRTDHNGTQYMIHCDTLGRIVKIGLSPDDTNPYVLTYENNRVSDLITNSLHCKYIYDEKGRLKMMYHHFDPIVDKTFHYTLDKGGKIVKIDEYEGSKLICTHKCKYGANKLDYSYEEGDCHRAFEENVVRKYNNRGDLASVMTYLQELSTDGNGRRKCIEYRFEYDKDGNPTRCIEYEIGDITVAVGGYDYEYSYTFYPSK